MSEPVIIQGGMGVAVSSWQLARAVSSQGQLGVISGTALDVVVARRLQLGDPGGHLREAFNNFPIKHMAEEIWDRYFRPGGKEANKPFKAKPVHNVKRIKALDDLMVVANFVEVWLAKQGHNGKVGINLLEKIQLPTIPSIFGAMLAGVDYVIMGAGIPRAIPGIIEKLSKGEEATLPIEVSGATEQYTISFDPKPYLEGLHLPKRPKFLAIVSSNILANLMIKKVEPPADGLVIEGFTAGGHNAPPRGAVQFNEIGEPIYTEKDVPDLAKISELGVPFWLAGSYGTHEKLLEAQAAGAVGIQVGSAFALCDESGMLPEIKKRVIKSMLDGTGRVFTDPKASPTGFPFKVVNMEGSMARPEVVKKRNRICDLGYLRSAYVDEKGVVGFRCCSEPIDDYVRKGGDVAETDKRLCVCNGLMATIGLGQVRHDGALEPTLVTGGDEMIHVARFLKPGADSYTAEDVLDILLGKVKLQQPVAEAV